METLQRIEDLIYEGQLNQALSLIKTLYGQDLTSSDRGRALALEVVTLESLDQKDEAHQILQDIMKEEGDDHAFVLAAGIEFAELDAVSHAEMFLKNLCELDPENPAPWFNLAIALGREQRYSESIHAYEQCLEREPAFIDAYFQKAECHSVMGDFDKAADTYRTYLKREPDDGEAWVALAVVHSDKGDFKSAYSAFEKASTIDHDPEDVYYNWAITAVRNQDAAQMEHCVERLQDINPMGWRTLIMRADYEETLEHIWPAWEILNEAFEEVLDDEDIDDESRDYVVATLLRFANRNKMHEHAAEVVTRIFDETLFSEEVLGALQILESRASATSSSYQIVLKTNMEQSGNAFFDNEDRYIVYGASAESPEHALDIARTFEAKCSINEWETYSIHQLSEPDEGLLGVYWRSPLMDTAPGALQ